MEENPYKSPAPIRVRMVRPGWKPKKVRLFGSIINIPLFLYVMVTTLPPLADFTQWPPVVGILDAILLILLVAVIGQSTLYLARALWWLVTHEIEPPATN